MITRRGFCGVLSGGVALMALGGCGLKGREPDKTLRYKMTVVVEAPEGFKSGYSVRQLEYFDSGGGGSIAQTRPKTEVAGEAVAVDLPNGRTLFALLSGSDGDVDYGARIADRSGLWGGVSNWPEGKSMELWPTAPKTEKLINTTAVPMLVAFDDISNPASVLKIAPDDLSAAFGEGYRLKVITMQITDEAVTSGIDKRLAWLSPYPEPRLDSAYKGSTSPNLSQRLAHGAFRRGNKI